MIAAVLETARMARIRNLQFDSGAVVLSVMLPTRNSMTRGSTYPNTTYANPSNGGTAQLDANRCCDEVEDGRSNVIGAKSYVSKH